jgi:gliding motility-associated-like protein
LTLSGNIGTIQWQSSTNNVTFTNITGATASTYTATNITTTTYYRAVITSGVCPSAITAAVSISVSPTSVAGNISGATTVCSGTNSTVLTLSGNTGTIQWQSSIDNVTFTNITGATASTYTATNITATTYYRAVVSSGVCSPATTTAVTIIVNPISVAGSIAGATTVCSGTNSTLLTLSGNIGTIQWQSSTNNVTFTNITGATASTYTATNISATTYYRVVVTSGVCPSASSVAVTITYIPIVAPTAVSNQQYCYLNNPTVSSLVTTSGVGIKWYASATGGTPLTGSTPLTTATTYYASQTISVCESPTRVAVTVLLTCPVDAIADNFGLINGYAGATTASVLSNDTINGGILLPSQIILTGITVPTGLTLNANGTITIAPQTATGTYNITYRICEVLNPTNCDNVTFSIIVGACLDFAINDCDLDGESNGTETANGTNPSDACSYTNPPASSSTVYPTWSVLDCDGDGVINGQEITDGTSPTNPCSSNPINITVPLSASFLNGDCDSDGLLNGEEMGSNVNYPNDSNGNGIPDYLEVNNHTVSEDNLEVYSSLTPNGDGNNDLFIIRNIENYPENNVSIYNRWGIVVYDVDGYGQDNKYFKGVSEGRITINSQDELPIGTYFYIIKYKNNNGEQKQRSGYLYINR